MNVEQNSYASRINWDGWIREIRDIGKTNPLTNFEPNEHGQIDLERSHPGGIAQFSASGSVLLSNLVREPLAYSKAISTARRIKDKATAHLSQFGIHTTYLAGGLANLEQDGFDFNLPIVLWPLELFRKTDDFELNRVGAPFVNPALSSALFHTYGLNLDSRQLLKLLENSGDLFPIAAMDYLAKQLEGDTRVEFRRNLVIGNFAIEPSILEADIKPEGNKLLRQLAEVSEVPTDEPNPLEQPRLVADADVTQKRIVARAVRGESFAVETLPGSGYTQTVVNVLAALASERKRVLVVTPRRQTLNEISERLAESNLAGLLVRSFSTWLDLIGAISRFEKAGQADPVALGVSAEATARKLEDYLESLRERNQKVGFSVLEIMEELAKLALTPHAPNSTARITLETLQATKSRQETLALLEACQEQGLFNSGPADSPWFGASFESLERVQEITELTARLHATDFPELQKRLDDLVIAANFKSPKHLDDFADYLALWSSVAMSLDRFVPEVFDRDVTELIEATGPRKLGSKVSGSTRRKLKKLAKEFVRKGTSVSDLHGSLVDIKTQRDRWAEFSNEAATPMLMSGVSDTNVFFRTFMANLQQVKDHVEAELGDRLNRMLFPEFTTILEGLATKLEPLENLENRNQMILELKRAGLEVVHRDFANLNVRKEGLAPQFEQVWWQSAFEIAVRENSSLLSVTAVNPTRLFEDFELSDQSHIQAGALALNQVQSQRWRTLLLEEPEEGDQLKQQLRARTTSIRALSNSSPRLMDELVGILGISPYEVPSKLPSDYQFDTVLILDAAGSTVGENVSALLRAEQVLAFGDSAIAAPIGFELEASENSIELEPSGDSVFNTVARIFGVETMRKSWRPAGQMLGELVNREFYQNRILYEATAGDYLGKLNFDIQVVRSRQATEADLMAESPDAEVSEAVNVILRHVIRHPEDSLMVVTASDVHSERVRGQLASKILENAELKQFFDSHGDEKFEISTLNKLTHRVTDRVIFTPGFGVLANGKAANDLGQLSEPSGRRTLANLLVSARNSLTVVTSISADSLPERPVGAAKQFAKMYSFANPRSISNDTNETDPLLSDLALRLRKLGTHVTLGYTSRIAMAASYGAKAAVIVPDWNLVGEDLSEQVRLRPALLEAMGWEVILVHALEVFADPQGVAIRIGDRLGMGLSKKTEALFDEASFDETAQAWGDLEGSNDQRLKDDKPPHWG
jgi:hypothetical protein